MVSSITAPETITLKDGFIVSIEALNLAWALEAQGLKMTLADDGGLLVSPRRLITVADDAAIREHRHELIALTRYGEGVQ